MTAADVNQRVKVLSWDDVRAAAVEAFNVWTYGSELEWAKEAWAHLMDAGLADYTSELTRARVAVRFLSLASLYRDWCCIAHEECLEDDPADWMSWLDVDKLEIGQLLGDRCELGTIHDYDRIEEALTVLSGRIRAEVARALLSGHGGVAQLFVALWRTTRPRPGGSQEEEVATEKTEDPGTRRATVQGVLVPAADDEEEEEDDEDDWSWESDDEILNTVTGAKAQVWRWIEEGCPPYR